MADPKLLSNMMASGVNLKGNKQQSKASTSSHIWRWNASKSKDQEDIRVQITGPKINVHMTVSINGVPKKLMVYNGKTPLRWMICTPIPRNVHIANYRYPEIIHRPNIIVSNL